MGESEKELSTSEIDKRGREDVRFYGEMRFKQLTLWSVGLGFLLNLAFARDRVPMMDDRLWGMLYMGGYLWTAVFWVMEVRSSVHGVHSLRSVAQFERDGDREVENKWTLVNAINVIAILYASLCLFFNLKLRQHWGTCTTAVWAASFSFLLLVLFNIREYWHMWRHAIRKWQW